MNFLIYADDFYQEYKRGVANYGFNLIKALKKPQSFYIFERGSRFKQKAIKSYIK